MSAAQKAARVDLGDKRLMRRLEFAIAGILAVFFFYADVAPGQRTLDAPAVAAQPGLTMRAKSVPAPSGEIEAAIAADAEVSAGNIAADESQDFNLDLPGSDARKPTSLERAR